MTIPTGYQEIGASPGEAEEASYRRVPYQDAVAGDDPGARLGRLAVEAGEFAHGVKGAIDAAVSAPDPEIDLFTDPLNPTVDMNLRDRAMLILSSCRAWHEFFDLSQMNWPRMPELKQRIAHNFEVNFYNYFVVTMTVLLVLGIFHIATVLLLGATAALAAFLFLVHPDPIVIHNSFALDNLGKTMIMVMVGLFVVFKSGVIGFLFSVMFFSFLLSGAHMCLREHAVSQV